MKKIIIEIIVGLFFAFVVLFVTVTANVKIPFVYQGF